MRTDALLVNTSRSALVDMAALVDARAGRPATQARCLRQRTARSRPSVALGTERRGDAAWACFAAVFRRFATASRVPTRVAARRSPATAGRVVGRTLSCTLKLRQVHLAIAASGGRGGGAAFWPLTVKSTAPSFRSVGSGRPSHARSRRSTNQANWPRADGAEARRRAVRLSDRLGAAALPRRLSQKVG
jgi:hypothetical protein